MNLEPHKFYKMHQYNLQKKNFINKKTINKFQTAFYGIQPCFEFYLKKNAKNPSVVVNHYFVSPISCSRFLPSNQTRNNTVIYNIFIQSHLLLIYLFIYVLYVRQFLENWINLQQKVFSFYVNNKKKNLASD